MNRLATLCAVGGIALTLAGCSTIAPVTGDLARVTKTAVDTEEIRVERLELITRDGAPVITGQARRRHELHPLGLLHIDVVFQDAARRELATRSVRIAFSHKRNGPETWVFFAVPLADWPAGTAELVVRPHAGWTHEAPAS